MTIVNFEDLDKLRRELMIMLHHPTGYEAIFRYNERYYRIQSVHTSTNFIQLMETSKQGKPISNELNQHSFMQLPLDRFKEHAKIVCSDDM